MPDYTELNSAIDSYEAQSYGSDSDGGELSRQRGLALDAFQGKNIEPAAEGRSQVVDFTVFETCMWIMPSLMRIYAGGSNIVEFDPAGPEDEEAAEQESFILNHMVQGNEWETISRTWMQDALVTKNSYCMAHLEEKIVPEVERYESQSEEQVSLLLQDDVEVVGQNQYNDPDDEGTLLDPATGQPVQDEITALGAMALYEAQGMEPQLQFRQKYDIEIRKTKATKKLKFKVLPPERCKIGQDTSSPNLEDCNYFEFWDDPTISDLRKMGYDIEDDIASDGTPDTIEDTARDEIFYGDRDIDSPDSSMRQVRARWIWIRHDYDGDGIAELLQVLRVGSEILSRDGEDPVQMVSTIPVSSIVPFLNTHRHVGMSVADLTFDIQRIKTAMLRSGLDSLYLANNPRHAISDRVNIDDLLVSRPGGVVRISGGVPGEGHIMPLQTENTFPYAQAGLEHMDRVIEARVGVNRMFQGIDSSNLNDHNRVGQLSTMAAQRVEDIARIFAPGFERLFKIAHELVVKSGHQGEAMKLRGEWVNVDPTEWRTGRDMRIVAPFAAGNKDSLVQRLMIHMQVHREALSSGAPFVQMDDTYELAKMLAEATDVSASKIYTDPATVQPPEPPPDHTMIALEIENKNADTKASDSQLDAETDKYKTDVAAEIDKYRADLQAQTQIALAQIKEGQQVNLETLKARLKDAPLELGAAYDETKVMNEAIADSMMQIQGALEEVRTQQTAPIKVVRENGKIVGKEVAGQFVPLEDA